MLIKGRARVRYVTSLVTTTYAHNTHTTRILHIFIQYIHAHTHTHLQVGEKGYEFFKVDFTATVDVDFIEGGFRVLKWFMVDGTREEGGRKERTREEGDVEWASHWLVY